ncbi:unnamed protein product [Spirodela intermedia]|uniref:Uncharacterized protein n=1 Tax=Spirodela intermedia TaxID=51605 RepID=A0A7I8J4Q4_SPIIN|nr:unnamed protein product [Spirodela intermedia]CAA6665207.1 unnamed protein product [Spirodela intermedia]
MAGLLDLEKHYAFYGAYHGNPVNVLIHVLFVWPIFFSALLLFYFTPPFFHVAKPLGLPLVFNFGSVVAAFYALFYLLLERKAGSLAALLCILCWVGSSILGSHLGFSLGWKLGLVVQLFCWTGQFIGHGVFEGRAPAILDNLFQALVTGPLFVLLEALQSFFTYEPYPGFHAKVQAKVDAELRALQKKKNS